MEAAVDRRAVGTVLLAGAFLGIVGNALHPIFPPDVSDEAFLLGVASSPIWLVVHLLLAVAVVVSAIALRLLARLLADTPGGRWANVTAGLATITGTVFALQLAGIDGVVLPALADQLRAGGGDLVLRTARAWIALDLALLSVSVIGYLGVTYLALGRALLQARAVTPWLAWAAVVVGTAGTINGVLMYLGLAEVISLYAFRVVGLAGTGVGLALGLELHRPARVAAGTSRAAAR